MKKILFALAACASLMTAQAEVTLFTVQGAPMCRYHGDTPDQIVEMQSGYSFRLIGQTYQRVEATYTNHFLEKELPADRVQMWGIHMDGVNGNGVNCMHTLAGSLRWYKEQSALFTPADGLTITKIMVKADKSNAATLAVVEPNGTEYTVLDVFSFNATDSTYTVTGNYDKPVYVINNSTAELRAFFVEVTTTGSSKQVAVPEFNIEHNMVAADETVELTCATPGAKIYYTIDETGVWNGSRINNGVRSNDATTSSTLYTGPIKLEKNAIIRAIAVKDGMTNSFQAYKEFYVMPEYDQMAVFNFNDFTSIKDEDGNQIANYATYPVVNPEVSTSTVENVSITKTSAVSKDVSFIGSITDQAKGTGTELCLSNTFGGVVELRPKKGSKMFISVPDDMYITSVFMVASRPEFLSLDEATPGELKNGFVTSCQKIWTSDSKDIYEVTIDVTGDNQYVDCIYVFYGDPNAGIEEITVDNNAPVEYYNLQGCRITAPAKGQFVIKRQGAKVNKIIF